MVIKSRKSGHNLNPIKLSSKFENIVLIESNKCILILNTLNIIDFVHGLCIQRHNM